jgi:N-acetylglucosamine malate deacetylase 1
VAYLVMIASHLHDETLGCGGVLARAFDPLVVFGAEPRDHGKEIGDFADELGFRCGRNGKEYEAKTLSLDRRTLVEKVQKILAAKSPDVACIPSSSYHQDHIVEFETAMGATRPLSITGYLAKAVIHYKYPGSAWNYGMREAYLSHYVDTSLVMDRKAIAVSHCNGADAASIPQSDDLSSPRRALKSLTRCKAATEGHAASWRSMSEQMGSISSGRFASGDNR